jgi:hypothetical protein
MESDARSWRLPPSVSDVTPEPSRRNASNSRADSPVAAEGRGALVGTRGECSQSGISGGGGHPGAVRCGDRPVTSRGGPPVAYPATFGAASRSMTQADPPRTREGALHLVRFPASGREPAFLIAETGKAMFRGPSRPGSRLKRRSPPVALFRQGDECPPTLGGPSVLGRPADRHGPRSRPQRPRLGCQRENCRGVTNLSRETQPLAQRCPGSLEQSCRHSRHGRVGPAS